MLKIADYEELYMPTDTKGRELVQANYVKVPAKPKGNGLEALFKYRDGLKVFAVWILILEATTAQKKGTRGTLCNHKDGPASIKEVAKSILLGKQLKFIKYAIGVLAELGWILDDGKDGESVQDTPLFPLKSRVVKSRVVKPPSLEQINNYIREKGLTVNGDKFLRWYTESNWCDNKGKPFKNWKLKLLSWDNHNQTNSYMAVSKDTPQIGSPVQSAYRIKYEAKIAELKAAGEYIPGMKIEV